jgi:dephospho-CoA kinase
MAMLLALTGLAGAGKTTVCLSLARRAFGSRYYAGQVLREELVRRQLPVTPENERLVRSELRAQRGMNVFAQLACPEIRKHIRSGHVLLDAVYCVEERDHYRAAFGDDLRVIAVVAPQAIRVERLKSRSERPITLKELTLRDELELDHYRLGEVVETADHSITNVGTLDELEASLGSLLLRLGG